MAGHQLRQHKEFMMLSRTCSYVWLTLLFSVAPFLVASAASPYTETFSTDIGGWEYRSGAVVLSHQGTGGNPDGCLQAAFTPTFPNPPGFGGSFEARGAGASVAFTGNYLDADVLLVGFDAWSDIVNDLGQGLVLKFHNDLTTNSITRDIPAPFPASNRWYSYRFAISKNQLNGWYDDTALYDTVFSNITRMEFILRLDNGSNGENYRFDNIFVDALPVLGAGPGQEGESTLVWNNLRSNEVYRLEHTTDLAEGIWSTVGVVTAQTATITTDVVLTNQAQYFRMVME